MKGSLVGSVLVLLLTGCTGSATPIPRSSRSPAPEALTVRAASPPALPPQAERVFQVRGVFPQVFQGSQPLVEVNALLRARIKQDQRESGAVLYGPKDLLNRGRNLGMYDVGIEPRLVYASSVVVSVMLPALFHAPGGAETDNYWIGATVDVRNNRIVETSALFANPRGALSIISTFLRQAVRTPVTPEAGPPCADRVCLIAVTPDWRNFRDYALTPEGLAVGLGELCGPSCGAMYWTVPWRSLQPYLNPTGVALQQGIRRPEFYPRPPSTPTFACCYQYQRTAR